MFKILLIDDKDRKKDKIDGILHYYKEDHGEDTVSMEAFKDERSGLEALVPGRYDLVLLDQYLDEGGNKLGTSLIPEIRQIDPDVKIWMYTSAINFETSKKAGADDVLNPSSINYFDKLYNHILHQVNK